MKNLNLIIAISFTLCLITLLGAIGAWILGYAHGQAAGLATFGLMLVTGTLLKALTGKDNFFS